MKHNTMTITTDFGDSFAVAQLHAVIDNLGFNGKVIENHSTHPFAIHAGAFEIATLAKFCQRGTVHLGVIDPGVGSERAGIIIKTNDFWFVGPDNGLLYPAAAANKIERVWKVNESFFENVTKTFHGRDIFIKATVYLATGKKPEDFGCTLIDQSALTKLNFQNGQVLHIDAYGNLKVYFDKKPQTKNKLTVEMNKNFIEVPVVNTFDDVEIGKPLAYLGSSGTLELALNQESFAQKYGVKIFDTLIIELI